MKKFLVLVLLLIPVVILLALSITGGIIKSISIVEVKELLIKDEFDKPFNHNAIYTLDLIGQDALKIMVLIKPAITYDKTIIFECIQGEEYDGQVRVEKIAGTENQYNIFALQPGLCKLKIYAANNIEANAYIDFYITSNVLQSLNIFYNNQKLASGDTVFVQGGDELNFSYYPAESIGSNLATWGSSNEEVAEIDDNGCLYLNSFGKSRIWVAVTDKEGRSHSTYIFIDTSNAIAKSSKVYYSGEINEYFVSEHIALSPLYQVQLIEQSTESSLFRVENDKYIYVDIRVFQIEADEWDIFNRNFFSYDNQNRARVYLDNGGYTVRAGYLDFLDNTPLAVKFSSSDESIASVNPNGTIIPKKIGKPFTIYADANGKRVFLDCIAYAKANAFSLNLSNEDNLKGIKQERIWALNWYDIILNTESGKYSFGEKQNYFLGYREGSAVYNKQNISIDLIWKTNNSSWASVDAQGCVTFYPAACGNTVKVTAYETIEKGFLTGLSRSYEFKVHSDKDAINVTDIVQFVRASKGVNMHFVDGDERIAILQADIYERNTSLAIPYNDKEFEQEHLNGTSRTGDNHWNSRANDIIEPVKDIFGNGFKIRGEGKSYFLMLISLRSLANAGGKPLLLENLEISGGYINDPAAFGNYLADDTEDADKKLKKNAIWISDLRSGPNNTAALKEENKPLTDEEIKKCAVTFKYCYINFAFEGITLYKTSAVNLTLEGCIISNVQASGITVEYLRPNLGSITLDRLVIRDSLAMGIMGQKIDKYNPDNYIPQITIKGFYDAYVWVESTNFGVLDKLIDMEATKKAMPEYATLLDNVNKNFDKIMIDLFREKKVIVNYNGQEYCNLALIFFGLWAHVDSRKINDTTVAFSKESFVLDNNDKIFGVLTLGWVGQIVGQLVYKSDPLIINKPNYYYTYKVTDSDTKILPDSRIPSNKALYARLQGADTD